MSLQAEDVRLLADGDEQVEPDPVARKGLEQRRRRAVVLRCPREHAAELAQDRADVHARRVDPQLAQRVLMRTRPLLDHGDRLAHRATRLEVAQEHDLAIRLLELEHELDDLPLDRSERDELGGRRESLGARSLGLVLGAPRIPPRALARGVAHDAREPGSQRTGTRRLP